MAPAGSVTNVIANATNVRPAPQYGLPQPSAEAPSATGTLYRSVPAAAKPAPAAPLAFAPMPSVAQTEQAAPAQDVSITGSRIVTANELQARTWLQKIEDLLKANERDAALAEWRKFRAAYPAYPVPDTVSEQFPPEPKP